MPFLSGSSQSFLKACAIRWSSKHRTISAQSSGPNSLYKGIPPPMSSTSSTPKMSTPSKSTSSSSSSSSSTSMGSTFSSFTSSSSSFSSFLASSSSFFAFSAAALASASFFLASLACLAAAFFCILDLYSGTLACHCWKTFCQAPILVLNHADGTRSSTRLVSFLSLIHFDTTSGALSSFAHSYLISSKPSSASGTVNLVKLVFRTTMDTSGVAILRYFSFFSSAVSSTFGGSSSTSSTASSSSSSSSISTSLVSSSSSSGGTSLPSASSFFRSASFFALSCAFFISSNFFMRSLSAFFFAFSSSFCLFSAAFFLASSSFFILNSLSDCSCLSFNISSKLIFLKSAGGSPTTTMATFLKELSKKRLKLSALLSFIKLDRSSITM
mmetsp:Transcript_34423/g.64205  ORF Transcript_34423/g.64205 Transcript_34423/m.64205 type:complete len:384 (-) Transcript_34423:1075-2226(-)